MSQPSNTTAARAGDSNEPIHQEGEHHITFEPEESPAPDRRGQVGGGSLDSASVQVEEGVVLARSHTMEQFHRQVNVDSEGVPHAADPKDMKLHEMVEITGEVCDASAAPGTPNSGLMVNSSFGTFPGEVVRIARQMRGLDETQFLTLADLTQKRAWTNVYSLLQYRGTAWYLPTLRPVEEGEPEFGIGRERTAVLWFTLFGWRMELNLLAYVARAAFLVLLWLSFWSIFPHKDSERKGQIFDPVVMVLFSTIVGGIISRLLRIPPLVCILWMSIMWGNIPSVNYLTSGITTYVRKSATTFGLTVILIRAGLYIKLDELRPMAATFIAFAFLPAAAELISHSFMAKAMFDYPDTNWAFLHGSVAAAVSPAVVVPAVLTLKLDGYGVTHGPGLLMMPAAPAEMVVAIWNINFMSQLTLDTGDVPLWLNIFLGPVQIIGGIVLGVILGALHFGALKVFLSEAKKLPHRNYTQEHMNSVAFNSTCLLVIAGVAVNAYTKYVNLAGGGAIAVTVMAMTTGTLMRRREKTIYFADQFKLMCLQTADLWDSFTMPVLFSMVGSSIDLGKVFTAEFFPKVLACLAVGLACRMIVTQLVTFREKYTIGERVFMAVGWIGKATVQAAIGRVALDRARDIYGEVLAKSGRAAADGNIEKAIQVANSGIVLIMICAPIASLVMVRLGPKLLQHEGTGGLAGGH